MNILSSAHTSEMHSFVFPCCVRKPQAVDRQEVPSLLKVTAQKFCAEYLQPVDIHTEQNPLSDGVTTLETYCEGESDNFEIVHTSCLSNFMDNKITYKSLLIFNLQRFVSQLLEHW